MLFGVLGASLANAKAYGRNPVAFYFGLSGSGDSCRSVVPFDMFGPNLLINGSASTGIGTDTGAGLCSRCCGGESSAGALTRAAERLRAEWATKPGRTVDACHVG